MSDKVKADQFAKAVMKALGEYGDEVNKKLEVLTKDAARETRSEIKKSAPSGGDYAKGWSNKAQKTGRYNLSQTVYNRTDYQLIHLLEYPHDTGGGGHYPKNVDYTGTLARIEEEQVDKYYDEVMAKL